MVNRPPYITDKLLIHGVKYQIQSLSPAYSNILLEFILSGFKIHDDTCACRYIAVWLLVLPASTSACHLNMVFFLLNDSKFSERLKELQRNDLVTDLGTLSV